MALTPMMQQYLEVKEKYNDCILFFRLGDFYEMFFEDAEKASRELELVLTGRDCGLAERAPMCGVPFHAANTYISRLVHRGYKIAICEQMEDPALAKGIVKRDVIKIVTPGTYMDPNFLEEHKNNYLVSLYLTNDNFVGLGIADISTGELTTTSFRFNEGFIIDEISKYNPKEIILQSKVLDERLHFLKERFPVTYTNLRENQFTEDAREHLKKQFPSFEDQQLDEASICATNGLLLYIKDTQKIDLSNLNQIVFYSVLDYLSIDINSRRNLELTETLRDQSKKGTLLWVLDKTSTAMGARQLRRWIERPLVDAKTIQERLDSVEEILANIHLHEDLKEALKAIYDIERIAGKIASKGVNARELLSLKNSIGKLPAVKKNRRGLS